MATGTSSSSFRYSTPTAEQVYNIQETLHRHSIDYRIIGSVAAHGYGLVKSPEAIADIDIILPRADLLAARALRKTYQHASSPVKIGLAVPSMQVDFRPESDTSFLTLGDRSLPIATEAFTSTVNTYQGGEVTTVPLSTLHHFYRYLSPENSKYSRSAAKLESIDPRIEDHDETHPLHAFHAYQQLNHEHRPVLWRLMDMAGKVERQLPPRAARRFRATGLKVADTLHWR